MGLRKFSSTLLMSTSVSDLRQIPAAGATVEVYRQGARVTSNTTVLHASATTVNVRSTGAILVADTVQAGTDTTRTFTVTEVTSATALKLQAIGANNLSLLTNERLVVISATLPVLYDNDASAGTPLTNPATADSQGYIEFYTPTTPFDMIVRLSGMTPEVYEDQESGTGLGSQAKSAVYFVTDYASVQAALDAIPEGVELHFPPGVYTAPTAAGWVIDKAMTLSGESTDTTATNSNLTRLAPYNGHFNSNVLTIAVSDVHIRNIYIGNVADPGTTGTTGGDGIRIGSASLTPQNVSITNVMLRYNGRHGINVMSNAAFDAAIGTEALVGHYGCDLLTLTNVPLYANRACGIRVCGSSTLTMRAVWAIGNRLEGKRLISCPALSIAGGGTQTNATDMADANWRGQISVTSSSGTAIVGYNAEDFNTNANKRALVISNCNGWLVSGSNFINNVDVAGSAIAIQVISGSHAGMVAGCTVNFADYAVAIQAADNNKGNVIFQPSVRASSANSRGLTFIPTDTSVTASSSGGNVNFFGRTATAGGLEGMSFIAGVQLPLVDSVVSGIGITPVQGMFYFDIAKASAHRELNYYDGSTWRSVSGS